MIFKGKTKNCVRVLAAENENKKNKKRETDEQTNKMKRQKTKLN